MPNCSGCQARLVLVHGPLVFTLTARQFSDGSHTATRHARTHKIVAFVRREFSQADLDRLTAKVQAFYNRLTGDQQAVFEALLRQVNMRGTSRRASRH
jgi:hypothetical protein